MAYSIHYTDGRQFTAIILITFSLILYVVRVSIVEVIYETSHIPAEALAVSKFECYSCYGRKENTLQSN